MLQQISLSEALERIEKGETVRCLVPGADGTWRDYQAAILNELLDGIIPLADLEEKAPVKRKAQVDVGRIRALQDAGWSVAKIADDMGISEPTVRRYMKKEDTE